MSSPERTVGVLVMAHGTPEDGSGLEAFYTSIRRGRPPEPAQLAELSARYQAIGGVSPLTARTAQQVDALIAALECRAPSRFVVGFGAKHVPPRIEAAARELVARGPGSVVGLVLTPHHSSMGSGEYLARAAAAIGDSASFVPIEQWFDAPGFADVMARRVRAALAELGTRADRVEVIFTAHSLPVRAVAGGDPYPDQLAESARLIAAAAGVTSWRLAWQSAGRTGDEWLGPDLASLLRGLPAEGFDGALVCPVGFVADHLEILYDLDIEAAAIARDAGLAFGRTASLNADPDFIEVLANLVVAAARMGAADQ